MVKIIIAAVALLILYYFLGIPFFIPSLSKSMDGCTQDLRYYQNILTGEIKTIKNCLVPLGWKQLPKYIGD